MNIKKLIKRINYILIIFLILSSTLLFNNKTIEKGTKNNLKALDQEGQTYRLVTSADNVQVPVPKGYVASQVTGENYVSPEYSHTTITNKISTTPTVLTWSSPAGETYPWTQDENGIWISGNQGIPYSTSTIESEEFDYIKGTTLTINYTYSNFRRDYLNIFLINLTNNTTTTIVKDKEGNTTNSFDYTTSNYTYTMNNWATGRYKIRAVYSKDGEDNYGQDSGYIKPSTYFKEDENGETLQMDYKTKIHDGGFVIYQLTDEELEIDPNGTSVIINDTNKDEAQRTRNQYVWVPVSNIEDIVITETANNGIMQFGQKYIFSDTSITKSTSRNEPRLIEQYDKSKYYLQKYSKIDKRESYLNKMQEDYARMIKSINKYKGFYIGRYETGDDASHSYEKNCFTTPRIVRDNINIVCVSWYNSYIDLERLSGETEKYVETGMIYDSLWDYTLKWLNETDTRNYEELYLDSGTWGNYSNNTITVRIGETFPARTGAIETITYNGEIYGDSPTSSNNVFDIAGNVLEWTRGMSNVEKRMLRGGTWGSGSNNYPAFYNYFYGNPNNINSLYGNRAILVIR